MSFPEIVEKTIQSALQECGKHHGRILKSRNNLTAFFPIGADTLESADDDLVEHIDQFLYRFMKLQDSMGTRLLPALYSYLEGSDEPLPFLDILGRLEKIGVIPSIIDWQFFRNLRNGLAHEYPENMEQTATAINTLFLEWPRMERLFLQARDFYDSRLKMSNSNHGV